MLRVDGRRVPGGRFAHLADFLLAALLRRRAVCLTLRFVSCSMVPEIEEHIVLCLQLSIKQFSCFMFGMARCSRCRLTIHDLTLQLKLAHNNVNADGCL